MIPAGISWLMAALARLKRSDKYRKKICPIGLEIHSTDMREAQRRILVAAFPAPGVTNDPLLSKMLARAQGRVGGGW